MFGVSIVRKRKEVIERGKKQTTKKETQKCLQSTKKREIRKKRYKHVPIFCERKGCCSVMRIIQFIVGNKVDLSHTQKNEKKGLTIHSKNALCHVILERKKKRFLFLKQVTLFFFSLWKEGKKKLWIDQEKKGSVCRLWDRLMKWKKYSAAHTRKRFFYIRYLSFSILCLKKKKEKKEERKKKPLLQELQSHQMLTIRRRITTVVWPERLEEKWW